MSQYLTREELIVRDAEYRSEVEGLAAALQLMFADRPQSMRMDAMDKAFNEIPVPRAVFDFLVNRMSEVEQKTKAAGQDAETVRNHLLNAKYSQGTPPF
jgi:hypothetical protein